MVLKIKNKMRFYKSLRVDIWGLGKLCCLASDFNKYKRIGRFFYRKFLNWKARKRFFYRRYIYRTDFKNPFKKQKRFNKRFITLRAVRLFYLTLNYRQFNRLANLSQKKDGCFENHFVLAVEGRVISFLYRSGFVSNMFDSLFYVKNSFVTLNRKIVNFPNATADLFSVLSFHPIIKRKIYFDLLLRLLYNKRCLFNPPRFLFVSYWFLFSFFVKYPLKKFLVRPHVFLDIYRATKFAC